MTYMHVFRFPSRYLSTDFSRDFPGHACGISNFTFQMVEDFKNSTCNLDRFLSELPLELPMDGIPGNNFYFFVFRNLYSRKLNMYIYHIGYGNIWGIVAEFHKINILKSFLQWFTKCFTLGFILRLPKYSFERFLQQFIWMFLQEYKTGISNKISLKF